MLFGDQISRIIVYHLYLETLQFYIKRVKKRGGGETKNLSNDFSTHYFWSQKYDNRLQKVDISSSVYRFILIGFIKLGQITIYRFDLLR